MPTPDARFDGPTNLGHEHELLRAVERHEELLGPVTFLVRTAGLGHPSHYRIGLDLNLGQAGAADHREVQHDGGRVPWYGRWSRMMHSAQRFVGVAKHWFMKIRLC